MGILDDAIKEHLELKRQHGAAEDELKQLEDEAFGAAERPGGESAPDPFAEAPTEFMTQPPAGGEGDGGARSRNPDVADLQEAPPRPEPEPAEPAPEPELHAEPESPAEEEAPAMEHQVVSEPAPEPLEVEPEISSGPTTEEREAIAEQPTEMFEIEEEPEEALAEDAATEAEEDEYEEDDDFWDEKRLSDELDQALEPPTDEAEEEEGEEPEEALFEDAAVEGDEPEEAESPAPSGEEEDVLEETPDFLEEAPEDDQLWFEQKPPKDFDFDD